MTSIAMITRKFVAVSSDCHRDNQRKFASMLKVFVFSTVMATYGHLVNVQNFEIFLYRFHGKRFIWWQNMTRFEKPCLQKELVQKIFSSIFK